MPNLNQVRTKVDNWLTAKWPILRDKEIAYYGAHGVYWQGLWSHTALPLHDSTVDGDVEPDGLSSKPTDQAEAWLDFWAALLGIKLTAAIRVDVYAGPLGDGFAATVAVKFKDKIYLRAKNFGPENYRTYDWFEYEVGDEPHPFLN